MRGEPSRTRVAWRSAKGGRRRRAYHCGLDSAALSRLRRSDEDLPMTTDQRAPDGAATDTPTTARMMIGGESVDAADGQTFDVTNPATGKVIATAPLAGREDVDRAAA